jgi:hypothetical protein
MLKMLNDHNIKDDDIVGKFPKYNKQLTELEGKLSKNVVVVETAESSEDEVIGEKINKNENKKRKLAKTNDSIELANTEPVNKERKVEDGEEAENGDEVVKKKKNRRRKQSVMKAKKLKKEIAEEATLLHLR